MFAKMKAWIKERNRVFRTAVQVIGASIIVGVLSALMTIVGQLELSQPLSLALVSVVTVLLSSWWNIANARKDAAEAALKDELQDLKDADSEPAPSDPVLVE